MVCKKVFDLNINQTKFDVEVLKNEWQEKL